MNLLRLAATVLTAAAALVWARVGPGALGAGLCALLAVLALESKTAWARALDASAHEMVAAHQTRELRWSAARVFALCGEPVYVALLAAVCGALLSLRARSAIRGVVLVGAMGVGVGVEYALKLALVSFPSGHVMGTATLLGLIAAFSAQGRGLGVKAAWALMAAAGVVSMACLALYCGVHSVTDVLGGMVLGAAMVSLGVAVVGAVESKRPAALPAAGVSAQRAVRSRVPAA